MKKYKEMTYTKRKDGRLTKKITVNKKAIYIYSNSAADLYKQYIDIKYKNNNGISVNTTNITFKQYAEKWFEINASVLEEATQNSIRNRLNHMYEFIADIKLKDLKQYHIKEIQTQMLKNGFTDVTNRTIMDCKRILEDAVNNDLISKNVANGIKSKKFPKKERVPLSKREDRFLLKYAKKHKYGLFMLILRYCGIRPEEAVALTLDDINLKKKILNINKAVSLARNQPRVKATKNLRNRQIPIPNVLIKPLKDEINYRKSNNIQFLFTKETDKYSMLTKQALKTHLNTFLNFLNENIETDKKRIKFTYYQLRHSYCTMLYYAGVKIKKAQELMGHSSIDIVYDVYTHLDEERENADKLINDFVSNCIMNEDEVVA